MAATLYQVVSDTTFALYVEEVTIETATDVFYTEAELKEEFLGDESIRDYSITNTPFIKMDLVIEHVCRFFNDNPKHKSLPNMLDFQPNQHYVNHTFKMHGFTYNQKYNAFYRYKPPVPKLSGGVVLACKRTMISTATILLEDRYKMDIAFKNNKHLTLKEYHKNLLQLFQVHNLTFEEVYALVERNHIDKEPFGGEYQTQVRAKLHTWWFE